MDPQQQKNQNTHLGNMINGSNGYGKSTSNSLCRQSSTRWTPTTEQIKLLKELYYIKGLRSPTADQIHTICAWLRRYGKVEGKNVFYWFQNHKARERQKKRLTPNSSSNLIVSPTQYQNNTIIKKKGLHWKQDQDLIAHNDKHPGINNFGASSSSSSAGVVSGGVQLVGSFGYGAVTLDNKVGEFPGSGEGVLSGGNVHLEWAPPPSYMNFLDKISASDPDCDQDYHAEPEIETLPLFPLQSEELQDYHDHDHHLLRAGFCTGGYWWIHGTAATASLELSLNSYGYGCCSPN